MGANLEQSDFLISDQEIVLRKKDIIIFSGNSMFGEILLDSSFKQISRSQFSRVLIGSRKSECLGYSLFCDRSQDGVSFRDIFRNMKFKR